MARSSTQVDTGSDFGSALGSEILNKNALSAAGAIIGVGSVGFGAGIMLQALPIQTVVALGTSGALLYAGDRKSKDLPINPFEKTESTEAVASA